MEHLIQALHWLNIDPKAELASLLVLFIIGFVLPSAKSCLLALADKLRTQPHKVEQVAAVVLERVAGGVGAVEATDPKLKTVAALVAAAIVEGAPDKAHAEAAGRKLAVELAREVSKALKTPEPAAFPGPPQS